MRRTRWFRATDERVGKNDCEPRGAEKSGTPVPRETFKAPEYNGNGDLEAFIKQFNDVAIANDWGARSALLHIRGRLREQEKECGQGQTLQAVFNNL